MADVPAPLIDERLGVRDEDPSPSAVGKLACPSGKSGHG